MDKDFEKRYIAARKRVVEADFAKLNPMQREAVLATEGPLLVLAGAGSGKTTVLINRVANLLKYGRASDTDEVPESATEADLAVLEAGPSDEARRLAAYEPVEPWRIIAITFTNKAADELKARLEAMLGERANDIWARTFHSACVRILRRDADKLGYPRDFTIYDTSDRLSIMKSIIREMDLDDKVYPPKAILARLDSARDELLSPEGFASKYGSASDPRLRKIAEIYKVYAARLFSAGAMDFDDLLYNTVRLFNEHPDVLEHYQRQFKYVLIDEYQDTNNLQYMLASMLADGWGNICVVGDDDQSIYKFRGATIENILSFEKQYKGCRTIRLEQNYRSTGHILSAANAVIANNTERKGKTLWTNAGAGDKLLLYTARNEDDEAQFVAAKILAHRGEGGNFRDCAVLYRMNAQSNRLEFAFKRNGIPYRVVGGMRFFDRAEIKVGDIVCVVGGGAIGLLLVQLARLAGAAKVVLSEPNEARRKVAKELGADLCINPLEDGYYEKFLAFVGGDGADVIIECAGNHAAVESAFKFARRGATILLFSVPKVEATYEVPLFDVYQKELTIKGTFVNPDTHLRAVELINSGRIQIAPIITHTFTLDELPEAIAMLMSAEAIKVIVKA